VARAILKRFHRAKRLWNCFFPDYRAVTDLTRRVNATLRRDATLASLNSRAVCSSYNLVNSCVRYSNGQCRAVPSLVYDAPVLGSLFINLAPGVRRCSVASSEIHILHRGSQLLHSDSEEVPPLLLLSATVIIRICKN